MKLKLGMALLGALATLSLGSATPAKADGGCEQNSRAEVLCYGTWVRDLNSGSVGQITQIFDYNQISVAFQYGQYAGGTYSMNADALTLYYTNVPPPPPFPGGPVWHPGFPPGPPEWHPGFPGGPGWHPGHPINPGPPPAPGHPGFPHPGNPGGEHPGFPGGGHPGFPGGGHPGEGHPGEGHPGGPPPHPGFPGGGHPGGPHHGMEADAV